MHIIWLFGWCICLAQQLWFLGRVIWTYWLLQICHHCQYLFCIPILLFFDWFWLLAWLLKLIFYCENWTLVLTTFQSAWTVTALLHFMSFALWVSLVALFWLGSAHFLKVILPSTHCTLLSNSQESFRSCVVMQYLHLLWIMVLSVVNFSYFCCFVWGT